MEEEGEDDPMGGVASAGIEMGSVYEEATVDDLAAGARAITTHKHGLHNIGDALGDLVTSLKESVAAMNRVQRQRTFARVCLVVLCLAATGLAIAGTLDFLQFRSGADKLVSDRASGETDHVYMPPGSQSKWFPILAATGSSGEAVSQLTDATAMYLLAAETKNLLGVATLIFVSSLLADMISVIVLIVSMINSSIVMCRNARAGVRKPVALDRKSSCREDFNTWAIVDIFLTVCSVALFLAAAIYVAADPVNVRPRGFVERLAFERDAGVMIENATAVRVVDGVRSSTLNGQDVIQFNFTHQACQSYNEQAFVIDDWSVPNELGNIFQACPREYITRTPACFNYVCNGTWTPISNELISDLRQYVRTNIRTGFFLDLPATIIDVIAVTVTHVIIPLVLVV